MGLNERRKIEELKTVTFPGRVKEIEEITGKAIPYEVDWASLADDAEGRNFVDNISCKSAMKMAFDNGVLEMHCAYALKTDGMFSDNEISNLLVAKL